MDYLINDLEAQSESFKQEYKRHKRSAEKSGSEAPPPFTFLDKNGKEVRVYNAFTFCLLLNEEVYGYQRGTAKDVEINGLKEFLPHFLTGYEKGRVEFERLYPFTGTELFGKHATGIARMFHELVFHEPLKHISGIRIGWSYVMRYCPLLVTAKELEFFGFYSAMIAGLDDLGKKFPTVLDGFTECGRPTQAETPKQNGVEIKLKVTNKRAFEAVYKAFATMNIPESTLNEAINGHAFEKRIFWPYQQTQLADLFRRLKKHNVIAGEDTKITSWLNAYFEAEVRGTINPVNKATCGDVIRAHKGLIPRENRLLLTEFPELQKQE